MKLHDIVFNQVEDFVWSIPRQHEMLADVVVYGDCETIEEFKNEIKSNAGWSSLRQLVNVAQLPGVCNPVVALADVHPGYGFPIGAVGAFDYHKGVITVAGVGFDCNCGVRVLKMPLKKKDVLSSAERLAEDLFHAIPAGVGSKGSLRLSNQDLDELLLQGAAFAVERGYGIHNDLRFIEEQGCLSGANPDTVSARAKDRQFRQVGTLGSGNHYLEVQYVEEIYDPQAAAQFGLFEGQVTVAIHCGSRALGHQIGTDYLKILSQATAKYAIKIPDKELVCAPIESSEAMDYIAALACGVNCAFANRQVLTHLTREVFKDIFSLSFDNVATLYDVGHNNAKIEYHQRGNVQKKLLIHRKGSTRALGEGDSCLPSEYRSVGQPVLVGGTMGTASYILRGTAKGMSNTFGSAIHGAGRKLSRTEAKKRYRGSDLTKALRQDGIRIKGTSLAGLAEEAPGAYKDIDKVVDIVHKAGINIKVAKLRPLICIKG